MKKPDRNKIETAGTIIMESTDRKMYSYKHEYYVITDKFIWRTKSIEDGAEMFINREF